MSGVWLSDGFAQVAYPFGEMGLVQSSGYAQKRYASLACLTSHACRRAVLSTQQPQTAAIHVHAAARQPVPRLPLCPVEPASPGYSGACAASPMCRCRGMHLPRRGAAARCTPGRAAAAAAGPPLALCAAGVLLLLCSGMCAGGAGAMESCGCSSHTHVKATPRRCARMHANMHAQPTRCHPDDRRVDAVKRHKNSLRCTARQSTIRR